MSILFRFHRGDASDLHPATPERRHQLSRALTGTEAARRPRQWGTVNLSVPLHGCERLAVGIRDYWQPVLHIAAPFMADDDATGGQQLLNHARPEWEAKIQPDGMADDLGREPIPAV
jgi:hypothetical protein